MKETYLRKDKQRETVRLRCNSGPRNQQVV